MKSGAGAARIRRGRGSVRRSNGRPRCAGHVDQRRLARQGVVEVASRAVELRGPRGQRIGPIGIEHVPHGQAELVQVVLHPQQLKGIETGAVGQVGLQPAQAGNLAGDVQRVRHHDGERQYETEEQRGTGRRAGRRRCCRCDANCCCYAGVFVLHAPSSGR